MFSSLVVEIVVILEMGVLANMGHSQQLNWREELT